VPPASNYNQILHNVQNTLLPYIQIYTQKQTWSAYTVHCYVSRASNTLIICCFMHFVASLACGIMKRSTAVTVSSAGTPALVPGPLSRLIVPYEKVINSGWRFFDVILSIVFSGRRAWTHAQPFSCGMFRSTIRCESLTHSRLQQNKHAQLYVKQSLWIWQIHR